MRRTRSQPRTAKPSAAPPARPRTIDRLAPFIVAAAAFVAFLPALGNGFVTWDDDRNFLTNPHYRGLGREQLGWMWSTFHLGHYVPLSWMTLGANYVASGMRPFGYHLTNMALHSLNAALLLIVARRLLGRAQPAASQNRVLLASGIAALLFALHPLRVESVVWITERRDVLSLAFMLLAVLAYLRHVESKTGRGHWIAYGLAIAAFACGLLSKATVMTLPAVLLILNVYPLRRLGTSARWTTKPAIAVYLELLPFALLSLGAIVLSMVALDPPPQLPIAGKLVVSTYSLAFYLWKTLVPLHLSPLYHMPPSLHAWELRFVAGYVTVAALVAILVAQRKRVGLIAALLAFVVMVLPMLGIVQNGPQIAADRYTYHAAPALALLAGGGFLLIRETLLTALSTVSGVVLLLLGALTWNQSHLWKDSSTLWTHVVAEDPEASIAHSSLASLLYEQNRIPEAVEHSTRAVALDPANATAHNAAGMAQARTGHPQEAIAEYQRAIELNPLDDQAENNWGVALAQGGDANEAIVHYQRAIFVNPDNADAQVNWGNALVRLGRFADAIPHFQEALSVRPDHADAHHNWGVALARMERYAEAVTQFRAALAINPNHAEAQDYLAKASALIK